MCIRSECNLRAIMRLWLVSATLSHLHYAGLTCVFVICQRRKLCRQLATQIPPPRARQNQNLWSSKMWKRKTTYHKSSKYEAEDIVGGKGATYPIPRPPHLPQKSAPYLKRGIVTNTGYCEYVVTSTGYNEGKMLLSSIHLNHILIKIELGKQ